MSNPNQESLEDQLYNSSCQSCDFQPCLDKGAFARILAAHQATTDQRVAEAKRDQTAYILSCLDEQSSNDDDLYYDDAYQLVKSVLATLTKKEDTHGR